MNNIELRRKARRQGFSLIELAVVMVILGIIISAAVVLMPKVSERVRLAQSEENLGQVEEAITGFSKSNSRLPFPAAVGGNGTENAALSVGEVPYRTLGLPGPALDESKLPVRYGLYRNPNVVTPADDADLGTLVNRYEPDLPNQLTITVGTVTSCVTPVLPGINAPVTVRGSQTETVAASNQLNRLDLCQALLNGAVAADNPAFVHTVNEASGNVINPAYLLLSGGVEDADGDRADWSLDDINEGGNVDFRSPEKRRDAVYDDVVSTITLEEMAQELSCTVNIGEVNALAAKAMVAKNLALIAYNLNEAALLDIEMKYFAVVFASLQVLIATGGVATSIVSLLLAIVDGILSTGVTAGSLVIPGIGIVLAAAGLVGAIVALVIIEIQYQASCDRQPGIAANLTTAIATAVNERARAVQADLNGGVE